MSKKNKITLKQYHKINCVDDIINITENIDLIFNSSTTDEVEYL